MYFQKLFPQLQQIIFNNPDKWFLSTILNSLLMLGRGLVSIFLLPKLFVLVILNISTLALNPPILENEKEICMDNLKKQIASIKSIALIPIYISKLILLSLMYAQYKVISKAVWFVNATHLLIKKRFFKPKNFYSYSYNETGTNPAPKEKIEDNNNSVELSQIITENVEDNASETSYTTWQNSGESNFSYELYSTRDDRSVRDDISERGVEDTDPCPNSITPTDNLDPYLRLQ